MARRFVTSHLCQSRRWRTSCAHTEVECKFRYTDAVEAILAALGKPLGTKRFTDVYWDTNGCHLTTNDLWLRQRDGVWELKVPAFAANTMGSVDVYDEHHGLERVDAFLSKQMAKLSLTRDGTGTPPMETFGLHPFAVIVTNRTSFAVTPSFDKSNIVVRVDLDRTDTNYKIGECELLVTDANDVQRAGGILQKFCRELALDTTPPIRGKVLEFIAHNRPKHYEMLVDCGLVQQKLMGNRQ